MSAGGRSAGGQRGQQKNVLNRLQTARVGLLAAFLGVFEQALLLGFRLFRVLAPYHQTQNQWLHWRGSAVPSWIRTFTSLSCPT